MMLSFSKLLVALLAGPALLMTSMASPVDEPGVGIISDEEMDYFLSTTKAELIFVGDNGEERTFDNPLEKPANTRVTYCNRRVNKVCGGTCHVYNGGATCINASGTRCLAATHNVGFCDRGGYVSVAYMEGGRCSVFSRCKHSCNQLSTCGTRLDNGFCYTPGTKSILVGTA